jgi:hypothetical protein
MQKLIAAIVAIAFTTLGVNAGQKAQKATPEEKAALKTELLNKYDANRDGKLDKSERSKMSKPDKKRARKAGLGTKHTEKGKTE